MENPEGDNDLRICKEILDVINRNKDHASIVLYLDLIKMENAISNTRRRVKAWNSSSVRERVQNLNPPSTSPPASTPSNTEDNNNNQNPTGETQNTEMEQGNLKNVSTSVEPKLNKYFLVTIEDIGKCVVVVNSIENDAVLATFCKQVKGKKDTFVLSGIPNDVNRLIFNKELTEELPEPQYVTCQRQIHIKFPRDLITEY